jgi:predicted transcriptional regulator YdeE
MNFKIISLPSFNFIGTPLRASNDDPKSMEDIGKHWQRFYSEKILDKISDKIDDDVLALYAEYEGDFMKPYTLILGCRVSSLENVPNDLVVNSIPEMKYAMFTAKGKIPDCIIETWKEIWNLWKQIS